MRKLTALLMLSLLVSCAGSDTDGHSGAGPVGSGMDSASEVLTPPDGNGSDDSDWRFD